MKSGLHKRGICVGVVGGLAACLVVLATGAALADIDVNAPVPLDISLVSLGPGGQGYRFQTTYAQPFYTYDRDKPNTSTCLDKCAEVWIPVYPSRSNASDIGETWKLIARPDGTRQWAYHGKPLYTFGFGDHEPPTDKDMAGHWHELVP